MSTGSNIPCQLYTNGQSNSSWLLVTNKYKYKMLTHKLITFLYIHGGHLNVRF